MKTLVKISEDLLNRNFPNNFLIQVAFEIRFPTDLTMKNKIAEFQGLIKNEFSTYEEGFSVPIPFHPKTEISNLIDYKFINGKDNLELYLKNYTIFGLRTKSYPGYKNFSKIFLNNIGKFIKISDVNAITRLGIRYINSIPLGKDFDKSNQLKNKFFNPCINKEYINQLYETQQINLKYFQNGYEIHQQFVFRRNPNKIYEAIIDLDNSIKGSIKIDLEDLEDKLHDLHNLIKTKFFEMIKDDFLIELEKEEGDQD